MRTLVVIISLVLGPQCFASQGAVTQEDVDAAFSDLNRILEEERMVPNFENGQPAGYKKYVPLPPGSKLDQVGLRSGESITTSNEDPSREEQGE